VKLLLDTHIWLWSLLAPDRLTAAVTSRLESPDAELWLSPISTWEALVLIEKGRLEVDGDPFRWVSEALQAMPLREAALTHAVALESRRIALPHSDPADRFLAASARVYELTLVTADERLLESGTFPVLANR
jgi:PIN domain nuclease of toxin-antitoxin system